MSLYLKVSKQVSLFKVYGSGMLTKSYVKPSNRFSDAEDIIKHDVKMLLKDMFQKVVSSETSKKNQLQNPINGREGSHFGI